REWRSFRHCSPPFPGATPPSSPRATRWAASRSSARSSRCEHRTCRPSFPSARPTTPPLPRRSSGRESRTSRSRSAKETCWKSGWRISVTTWAANRPCSSSSSSVPRARRWRRAWSAAGPSARSTGAGRTIDGAPCPRRAAPGKGAPGRGAKGMQKSGVEIRRQVSEAFEAIEGELSSPVFLTCEHASQRLPEGYEWHPADRRLVGTHWAYDLGAAEITEELATVIGAPAVLSRFSRLLIDPNRSESSETLFLAEAEGIPVELNRDLLEEERNRRIERFHRPYHEAIDTRLGRSRAEIVFSIHS